MQTAHVQLSPPIEFPPVKLSADDLLPTDILTLLVYRDLPQTLAQGLGAALGRFPHLTGRLTDDPAREFPPSILTDPESKVSMEQMESGEILQIDDIQALSLEQHLARFVPDVAAIKPGAWWRASPLFAARRVDFPRSGLSALCLRLSHMAVDGTGQRLFLSCVTAAMRGAVMPEVVHDRACRLGPDMPVDPDRIPEGHVECPLLQSPGLVNPDVLAAAEPHWFTVPLEALVDTFGGPSGLSNLRNRFAAWLACEARRIDPRFSRAAVWCNPRGSRGVPPGFTGNAGCYLHMQITDDDSKLAQEIRFLGTREGLLRIRETYQTITALRATGREIWWDGPHDDLLQLNLLPRPDKVADLGGGPPLLALLLTRNSSGLRIAPTACGGFILVEATLAEGVADELVKRCRKRGLAPKPWRRVTG